MPHSMHNSSRACTVVVYEYYRTESMMHYNAWALSRITITISPALTLMSPVSMWQYRRREARKSTLKRTTSPVLRNSSQMSSLFNHR